MPKYVKAREAENEREAKRIRKLAGSRHGPKDLSQRAAIIEASWAGQSCDAIAEEMECHPQTVRDWIHRYNAEGLEGLFDRPRPGRKRRISEAERSRVIGLVKGVPPGRLTRQGEGLQAEQEGEGSHWTLDSLAQAAQAEGIAIHRSQVRRILLAEGIAWRSVRRWASSDDPECEKKEPPS